MSIEEELDIWILFWILPFVLLSIIQIIYLLIKKTKK